jgi:hypothetical protein
MSQWIIKYNAKLIYISVYFIVVFVFTYFKLLKGEIGNSNDAELNLTIGTFIGFFFLFLPFTVPFLIVIPYWILKKKIPKKITLNSESLNIYYKIKSQQDFELDKLGYSINPNDNYSVITLYKKIKAKRGHYIFKKSTTILGLSYSLGWKKEQLDEIARELERVNIPHIELKRKGSLFEHLIE